MRGRRPRAHSPTPTMPPPANEVDLDEGFYIGGPSYCPPSSSEAWLDFAPSCFTRAASSSSSRSDVGPMSGASGTTVAESHCLVVPVVLVDLEQLVLWWWCWRP